MTFSRTATLATALVLGIPATASAAEPSWELNGGQGALGTVTQVVFVTPAEKDYPTSHGAVQIAGQAYSWGGSTCLVDLNSAQIGALMDAMTSGFKVLPVYRKASGTTRRCITAFSVMKA